MNDKSEPAGTPGTQIEAAPRREADAGPPEGLRALALDYPLALVGGGLVAGVLIGALLPKTKAGRLSRSALALAGVAGEFGLTYARKALDNVSDAAHSAATAGGRVADAVGERTGELIDTASEAAADYSGMAAETAESAVVTLRNSAEGLARQVIKLTSQLRH